MKNNEIYIGIDPGISGSICVLDNDANYIDHLLMPTMKIGKSNKVNTAALVAWLEEYKDAKHCYLEKVHAMPKQGVTSMFNFGHSAGIVEGAIVSFGIPLTLVTPQSWKKKTGLIGKDKDIARSRAIQLYPSIRDLDFKGKGQALADSILIARANIL